MFKRFWNKLWDNDNGELSTLGAVLGIVFLILLYLFVSAIQ